MVYSTSKNTCLQLIFKHSLTNRRRFVCKKLAAISVLAPQIGQVVGWSVIR